MEKEEKGVKVNELEPKELLFSIKMLPGQIKTDSANGKFCNILFTIKDCGGGSESRGIIVNETFFQSNFELSCKLAFKHLEYELKRLFNID